MDEHESEKKTWLKLTLMGEENLYHARDVKLYTFVGALACYNHVFFTERTEDDGGELVNYAYLFSSHPVYEDVAKFIIENDWPQNLNNWHIDDEDIQAFDVLHFHGVYENDSFPVEWVEGEANE